MSNIAQFPDLPAVREAAALWVARVDRGLSPDEAAALNTWLIDPVHQREFAELGGIWTRSEVLSVLADVFPRQHAAAAAPAAPAPTTQRAPARRGWAVGLALAASVVAAVLLLGPRLNPFAAPADMAAATLVQVYATTAGERSSVMLSDGSLLSLNTDSEITVDMTAAQRQLTLRRGEAHFEVAHDTSRPFIVAVGDHAVRAVGTAFNIRRRGEQEAEVLVTSGTVRVSGDRDVAVLNAGQLLALRADGSRRVTTPDAQSMEAHLAWRRGVLIFDGQTLAEAVAEIDRYTPKSIRLADPQLAGKRIVGYFPTDNLQLLLESLQANFGVKVTEDETQILLSARNGRASPD
jgi:transmembrane sensor